MKVNPTSECLVHFYANAFKSNLSFSQPKAFASVCQVAIN